MIQPKSIVAVKRLPEIYNKPTVRAALEWLPIQDEKTPYMIKHMGVCPCGCGNSMGFLEEGIIGYDIRTGAEIGIFVDFLIELMPPEKVSIKNIIGDLQTA